MERMDTSRIPKCLLVSRPVRGKRSVGGQKKRWNDVVVSDLKRGDLLEDWRKIVQDRGAWRCLVVEALGEINEQLKIGRRRGRIKGNVGGKEMHHQSHHPGSVRKLVVLSLGSPRLAWSITPTRFTNGWQELRSSVLTVAEHSKHKDSRCTSGQKQMVALED